MKRFFLDRGKGKDVLDGSDIGSNIMRCGCSCCARFSIIFKRPWPSNFRDESDGVMCQIEVEIIVCHR